MNKIILTRERKIVFTEPSNELTDATGNFKLDIQETAKFEASNLVVLVNFKGERLYLRKGPVFDSLGNSELFPLNPQELKRFGIQETKCSNSKYYVQETETETEGEKKRKEFDVTNAEDMKKARDFAERQLQELQGETEDERLKKLQSDLNERNKLLEKIAQKELEAKLSEHSLKLSDYASTEEAIEALKNVQQKAPVGGTFAPLSENQLTGKAPKDPKKDADILTLIRSDLPISTMGFDSQGQMITTLKLIAEDSADPRKEDARSYLKALAKKELKKNEEFELQGEISTWLRKGKDPKITPTFRKLSEEGE